MTMEVYQKAGSKTGSEGGRVGEGKQAAKVVSKKKAASVVTYAAHMFK